MSDTLTLEPARRQALTELFRSAFGAEPNRFFSAPGRTEIGGNHTDHQHGCVLAAAVNLDTVAAVRLNGENVIRVRSEGYPMCEVRLDALEPVAEEKNTTAALIRGVAAGFAQRGFAVSGFDAAVVSTVLSGSGLSSSAAFEVLVGAVLNGLFCDGRVDAQEIARIGQYAENVFFGKPSGLMDQMASSVGGLVSIDFEDPANARVVPVPFDFAATGYALCIVDSRASHADLTDEYAAIPNELKEVCAYFGKSVLREIPQQDFFTALPRLRELAGDRAVLRAIHYYQENDRALEEAELLRAGDFRGFLSVVKQSGYSSYMYLQNIIPAGAVREQPMGVALALCEHYLGGCGAYRVHGGGFAGTVQAFVPEDRLETFRAGIDAVLGEGACQVLSIRPWGGVEIKEA